MTNAGTLRKSAGSGTTTLNITVNSYAGTACFGFTGCRDTIPHLQRLAIYTGEALTDLEHAVLHG